MRSEPVRCKEMLLLECLWMLANAKVVTVYNGKHSHSEIWLNVCISEQDAFYKTFPSQFSPFCSFVIPVAKPQGTISARLTLKCNYHGNKLWLTAGLSYSQWTRCHLRVVLEVHIHPSGASVSSAEGTKALNSIHPTSANHFFRPTPSHISLWFVKRTVMLSPGRRAPAACRFFFASF